MQRVLDGAERGAHQAAAGAGRRGHRDEGERRRRAAPRHQGRQRLQEGPQGPHRAGRLRCVALSQLINRLPHRLTAAMGSIRSEPASPEGAGAGATVPRGGPEPGGGGAGGGQEGVRREGQGQPPQGHHRRQGLPPAAEEQPRRARAVLVLTHDVTLHLHAAAITKPSLRAE